MKALVIIDMQMEMQHRIDAGRECVNRDASLAISSLVESFRQDGLPIVHIRHCDDDPRSPLRPGTRGYPPMPCAEAFDGEPVFVKRTSSAFASTDLEAYLRDAGCTELVVTGAVAGFCVNSTVRAAADLGFAVTVARDAVIGFDLLPAKLSASTIFDVTMAHLEADFATVVSSHSLLIK